MINYYGALHLVTDCKSFHIISTNLTVLCTFIGKAQRAVRFVADVISNKSKKVQRTVRNLPHERKAINGY